MKKNVFVAVVLMLGMLLTFTGCQKKEDTSSSEKQPSQTVEDTEMTKYVLGPTGEATAVGYYFMYNGKMYRTDEQPGKAWSANKPEMSEKATELGEVTVSKKKPQNDMEGNKLDKGDIAYYDSETDTIIIHRVWITDYPWLIYSKAE